MEVKKILDYNPLLCINYTTSLWSLTLLPTHASYEGFRVACRAGPGRYYGVHYLEILLNSDLAARSRGQC